jgi:hypothetical protein
MNKMLRLKCRAQKDANANHAETPNMIDTTNSRTNSVQLLAAWHSWQQRQLQITEVDIDHDQWTANLMQVTWRRERSNNIRLN